MNKSSSNDDEHQVLRFRPRGGHPVAPYRAAPSEPPVEDLSRYAKGEQESAQEYRHRMLVNAAGLGFVIALVAAAIWLADTMATMRKNQDCVLSGRVGCTTVDYTPRAR